MYTLRILIDGLAEDKTYTSEILAGAAFSSTAQNYRRLGLDTEVTVQLLEGDEIVFETTIETTLVPIEPECLIDGSHMRPTDLDYLIVRYAVWKGMTLDPEEWGIYERGADDYPLEVSGLSYDDREGLQWLSESAVTWLNDNLAEDDMMFDVYESSLFYRALWEFE